MGERRVGRPADAGAVVAVLMQGRGQRRARKAREKARAREFLRDVWQNDALAEDEAYVGKRARTRVPCSCPMCGNPRRHGKGERLTLQERKADEAGRTQ